MRASIYLQINLIPIIMLIVLRVNSQKVLTYTWRNRNLRFMMVLVVGIMSVNTVAWMLDGKKYAAAGAVLWILNTLYYGMTVFCAFLWYLYVYDIVSNGVGQRGKAVIPAAIPLLLFFVLLVSNIWNHLLFDITKYNYYVRGKLFLAQSALGMVYLLAASVTALLGCVKEENLEKKQEYYGLAAFIVLPLMGGVLQAFFFGMDILWPLTSVSLLGIYVNLQQEQAARDALTGLNNRGRLDQYLETLKLPSETEYEWYCILADVDRFKKINDTYGHVVGDAVLEEIAALIKKEFGNRKSFLARYGGDEFVIILKSKSEKEVEEAVRELKKSAGKINWCGGSWKISLSAGYARYDRNTMRDAGQLISLADERMYLEKRKGGYGRV